MDLVTVSLDLLLAGLLIAALAYGVRLERRLKALREGHVVFAQAVRELDQSVLRAEAGLDQLRRAGEEARDGLHDRILKARDVSAELERMLARAERVRAQPAPVPQIMAAPTPAPAPARAAPRSEARARVETATEEAAERVAHAILSLGAIDREPEPELLELPVPELRRPDLRRAEPATAPAPALRRPESRAEPRSGRRPRTAADEELFETPPPELRRGSGGRR